MQVIRSLGRVVAPLAFLLLGGCTSSSVLNQSVFNTTPEINASELYVRGVFNWWEAEDNYRLIQVTADSYSIELDLIADGQPYDFKLADSVWSPHTNCGAESVSVSLIETQLYSLYCGDDAQNLQFTPSQTGRFVISVVQKDAHKLLLSIHRKS
ncbi:hypothetical protein [Alteromonas facilis]|uniref:hypothetical protein n=1 Tax=Alteromonas facilis TaxID=2048004 RepID=UPI000C292038|nr:hypothetical protein [Alteromonas facilis]